MNKQFDFLTILVSIFIAFNLHENKTVSFKVDGNYFNYIENNYYTFS